MQNQNWTGKIAQTFVTNKRLSLLLMVSLFIWGAFSFWNTPRQYNPKITAPAFRIQVDFPGASRSEVLEQVTKPLENTLAQIPAIEDIFSVTVEGGMASIIANFYVGEDEDSAKITLNDRIQSDLNLAPLGIQSPRIESINPDDVPVLVIALESQSVSPGDLRKFAFRLRDKLINVEGTSRVEIIGGKRTQLAIEIDPLRLARNNLGFSQIENALRRNNFFLPSGVIKQKDVYIPLQTTGVIESAAELRNLVIQSSDIQNVYLGDVATIREGPAETEDLVRHRFSGQKVNNSVLISIAKLKDTNIGDVTGNLRERMTQLEKGFLPDDIKASIIINEGKVARQEISRLVSNLFTSILIVVAILFFFLNGRAAFLVAISIPLTLATVFGISQVTGQNINRITLFALILSLGLLVDNATVVIENIVRRLKNEGYKNKEKTVIDSVAEVGIGLFMSTVTTVLAFIPMAFVTGMMGPYMGPIPFFVPVALVVSLGLSFTVNPWLATLLLNENKKPAKTSWLSRLNGLSLVTRLSTMQNRLAELLLAFLRNLLHGLIAKSGNRKKFLLAIALATVASFILPATGLVKFRMLPKADKDQFFIYLDLADGSSLEKTILVTERIEEFLTSRPEISMVQSYIGAPPILDFNGLFRGASDRRFPNQATIRAGLLASDERELKSTEIVTLLRPLLQQHVRAFSADAVLKMVEDPPGPPVLSTVLVRVQGENDELLNKVARDLGQKIGQVEEVVDRDTSVSDDLNVITLQINSALASRSRLSNLQIVETLNTAYSGKAIGIYHNPENIEQEMITLRLAREFRRDKSALSSLYIVNDLGIKVKLSDFVKVVERPLVKPLRRENRQNTAYVTAEMGNRSITYAAIDLLSFLLDYEPAEGYRQKSWSLFSVEYANAENQELSISIGGEWELTLEVFRDLGAAMGVAIFLIYFVLVAQFSSFREPLIIMSTIPLSLIGVLPGFYVLSFFTGIYFNATSMIGVIALAGIAVNNSIILLEYLNSLKEQGVALEEALVQAGITRFRPIMLTTVTTMLGSVTIAGDPVWAGLAYAIIFGLGISSMLTVLVFPVLYAVLKGNEWPVQNE